MHIIEQKGKTGIDLTIDVVFRERGVNLTQPRENGEDVDDILIFVENIPALISALDPERDKRIQELESQLEEAKINLSTCSKLLQELIDQLSNEHVSEEFCQPKIDAASYFLEQLEKLNTKQP